MTATPYLTPDDVRGRVERAKLATDDTLTGLISEWETLAESYVGYAFTPRDAVLTRNVWRAKSVVLPNVKVGSVTSVTVDGDPLAGFVLDPETGIVRFEYPQSGGLGFQVTGLLTVVYSHGLDGPDPLMLRLCARYVDVELAQSASSVSRNVLSQSGDGVTLRYSTPDWSKGRPTGDYDLDKGLNSYPNARGQVPVA